MPRRSDSRALDLVFRQPTDLTTLATAVTSRLRAVILDGQLPPGTALPPTQLAPLLGVSVMPVREALRILEAESLVSFTPRLGARVADVSEEDIEELYLVRGALEGLAARLAVERQTPKDLEALREALAEMRAAQDRGDLQALMRWDREFHRRQYGTSGRARLVKRILDLWDHGRRAYFLLPQTPEFVGWRTPSHVAILEACERGNAADAERLTRAHTEEAADRLLRAVRATRPGAPLGQLPESAVDAPRDTADT